jgi:hypothetical protein
MKIDIQLKKVLQDYGLDTHGMTKKIADHLGCHRHTIGNLYRNDVSKPSLDILGRICTWLANNNVPEEKLPQILFSARPTKFWEAISALNKVTIYLGEREQTEVSGIPRRWITLRDASALAEIVKKLTSLPQSLSMETRYVPFPLEQKSRDADIRKARKIYKDIAAHDTTFTSVFIGSQRVNYLVEFLVAGIFSCKAFHSPEGGPRVPFYLLYKSPHETPPSCFGGMEKPADFKGDRKPGIYYRNEDDEWCLFPWALNQRDAGILLTVYDPASKALKTALFGYSGAGTEALVIKLCTDTYQFWPPYVKLKEKLIGIYVCGFGDGKKKKKKAEAEEPGYTKLLIKFCASGFNS